MIFNVRLDAGLANRFDLWAQTRGGRSAALRSLLQSAVGDAAPAGGEGEPRPVRLTVRLSARDSVGLKAAAAELGLTPSGWAAALIRRRLCGRPSWPPSIQLDLLRLQTDLAAMRLCVSGLVRAQLRGELAPGFGSESLERFHEHLRRGLRDIATAMRAGVVYWDVER